MLPSKIIIIRFFSYQTYRAQWISGRVLVSRLRGCGFEPRRGNSPLRLSSRTHFAKIEDKNVIAKN